MRAEHGIEAQRAAQQRAVEALGDLVVDIDADQAQERAHLVPAESPQVESQARECREITELPGAEARRRRIQVGVEQVCETHHLPVELPIRVDIIVGDTANCIARVTHMLSVERQRNGLHRVARQFGRQAEFLAHFGLQLVQQVRAGRHRKAVRKLARDRRATDLPVRFQHEHLLACFREQCRADQPVVACANHDCVVAVSHRRSSPARYWAVSSPRESRGRHSRPAPP